MSMARPLARLTGNGSGQFLPGRVLFARIVWKRLVLRLAAAERNFA
jgi:hypothetical protein